MSGFFTDKSGINSKDLPRKLIKSTSQVKIESTVLKPKKAMVAFMFFVKGESKNVIKENDFKSAAPAVKLLG